MKMNDYSYATVLKVGTHELLEKGVVDASFDAWCLFEKSFLVDKSKYLIIKETLAPFKFTKEFFKLIKRRSEGEPLQYILENWDFMSYNFKVGEGVLIPRPETEMLVEFVQNNFSKDAQHVFYDLCSGSGCIGISIAKHFQNSKVYCIEKSEKALYYLKENVRIHRCNNVSVIEGDIKKGFEFFELPKPDCILSNPPYIETKLIDTLQKEVHFEPSMALDGGEDGYEFYRVIAEKWLEFLKIGGKCAVECGENQADTISSIFGSFSNTINTIVDFNNIGRVVTLVRQEKL